MCARAVKTKENLQDVPVSADTSAAGGWGERDLAAVAIVERIVEARPGSLHEIDHALASSTGVIGDQPQRFLLGGYR